MLSKDNIPQEEESMKKNWKKGIVALLCGMVALTAGGFAACDGGSEPPPGGPGQEGTSEAAAIATPVVTFTDAGATWEAVAGATSYKYKINGGAEQSTTERTVALQEYDTIQVKAVGDGDKKLDSAWSQMIGYVFWDKLEKPVVTLTGNRASWEAVDKAVGYKYQINDGEEQYTEELYVDLEDGQYIRVKAVASGYPQKDSNYSSNTVTYRAVEITVTAGIGGAVTGGGRYDKGAIATITATANEGYKFVRWSDGDTNATREITVTEAKTYTAEFAKEEYVVLVGCEASEGTVTGNDTYEYGEIATIEATAKEGYEFVRWSDGNTNATREITVTGNVSLTAEFAKKTYTVAVSCDTSKGTVTGGNTYEHGASVTITATANETYKFVRWSDGDTNATRTFTALEDKTLTAEFAIKTYTVTVIKKVSGETVTDNLVGKISGDGDFTHGTSGTLTAETQNSDYYFAGWYDGDTQISPDASYTLSNVTEDVILTAKWELNAVVLTLVSDFDIAGILNGSGTYTVGYNVTLTATPGKNYTFLGWYDGDTQLSAATSCSYTITKDTTLTAKWRDDWVNVDTGNGHRGYAYWTFEQLGNGVMPIIGFNSPNASTDDMGRTEGFASQINDANYQVLKDSGVNTIVCWWNGLPNDNMKDDILQELDLSEKYGIVYIVADRDALSVNSAADLAQFDWYMSKPAYGGTILYDEPGAIDFPQIAAATRAWENSKYANTLPYINHLPNYASMDQLTYDGNMGGYWTDDGTFVRTKPDYTGQSFNNYEGWVKLYLDTVKPQMFSYDYYPYLITNPTFFRDSWYTNLSNVRYYTAQAGVPYWVYGQLGGWPEYGQVFDENTKHLTYGHTALQFNSMLSYGAKGIQYYNYFMPPNYASVGDLTSATMVDGTPTPYYGHIQKINKQVAAIDHVLLRCAWKGIIQLNNSPAPISSGDIVSSYGALASSSAVGDAIVGCFEYRDLGYAYYVTTNNVYEASTVTLNFNGNYTLTKIQDGVESATSGSSITLNIPAGEGVLVVAHNN